MQHPGILLAHQPTSVLPADPGHHASVLPLGAIAAPAVQEKQQKEREARSGFRVEQTFNLEDFILPWASGERGRCGQQADLGARSGAPLLGLLWALGRHVLWPA